MKWLGVAVGIVFFLFAAVYTLLFTSLGNSLISPVIVKKINQATALQSSLEKFELRPGRFALTLLLSPGNRIAAEGKFELFGRSLTADYRVRCDELAGLQPLTKTPLYGKFRTEGTVTGKLNNLLINGASDIAASRTSYLVTLTDFSPAAIKATVTGAKAAQLLELVGKKPFSTADLSLEIDLNNLTPKALAGEVVLAVTQGKVDTALMKKEFDLTLPQTTYAIKATSHLAGSAINYTVSLESNLASFVSEGRLAPESLETDLSYRLDAKELALFKPLTNAPLRGPVKISGTVKGDRREMAITGVSDLAASQTSYDVTLVDLTPSQVLVRMNNAELAKLLYLGGQPTFARGRLDLDLTLTDLDPDQLKGKAEVKISNGALDRAIFKKEYDIVLPETAFTCGLDATLKGREVGYLLQFDSALAKIGSEGSFIPKTMGMDLKYRIDIAKLGLLQPFTGTPLRGAVKLSGTAKGDQKLLRVEGTSDLAGSATTFRAGLTDLKPVTVEAKIKNLKLASALLMVAKPHYGDGIMNIDVNIGNAKAGELAGTITSEISRGLLDSKVIAAEFELGEMPKTMFSAKTQTTLAGHFIDTVATLDSTMLTLKVKRARYDLDQAVLTSDYLADLPDLDRLFFVAGRHLKGAMTINGELEKGQGLTLTAHADTLGGRLDVTVHDDDLHVDLKQIQSLETLKMLVYPEVLASALDGTLDYNLKAKKGVFDATLTDGKFTRNVMFDLLLSLARTDLYKERFTGTLHSRIEQELITSDLDLRSRKSSIIGKKTTLNSKTKQINAKLDVLANNNPIGVTIKGNVDKPDIKLDTSPLIKKEATKVLEKEVNKLLKNLFK